MNKLVESVEQALEGISDGAVIGIAGFFACGVPRALLDGLIASRAKGLTLTCGCGALIGSPEQLEVLVKQGQIKKVIDSYPFLRSASKGAATAFEKAVRSGEIEVEIFPMGTVAEKYRAAAAGILAFYTPTGVGTILAEGKEVRDFNGCPAILEAALKPDYAFVHAFQGDTEGNLIYRMTARNFNPILAAAARVTIAEVENVVEPGELNLDHVHTPGIYVQKMIQVERTKVDVAIHS